MVAEISSANHGRTSTAKMAPPISLIHLSSASSFAMSALVASSPRPVSAACLTTAARASAWSSLKSRPSSAPWRLPACRISRHQPCHRICARASRQSTPQGRFVRPGILADSEIKNRPSQLCRSENVNSSPKSFGAPDCQPASVFVSRLQTVASKAQAAFKGSILGTSMSAWARS